MLSVNTPGGEVSMVKFPSTGLNPSLPSLAQSVKSLYRTPVDGFITLSLLFLIIFFTVAILQNNTIRKRIEKELEEAKAKDEAMLASIGDGLITTDKDGKITSVNSVFEKILGWNEFDVKGKALHEALFMVDEFGKEVLESERPITRILKGRTTATTTSDMYSYKRKDGVAVPVALTATPILAGPLLNMIGAIEIFRDITKEKEIEKMRTDFLALASHQLRTPLSGTKWLIETIQRGIIGEVNERQKEYLNNLYQINERMIELVSDMLNVLLLESGALQVKKQDMSVSKIYGELLVMMEPVSRTRGVALRNAFTDNETLLVQSDAQALRSILENLVGNAINYSQGGQEVVFDAKEELNTVVFSVKDSGIGIPKEEQKKIFERFYRASNAKESRPDGTGLGLYTAFLLAKKIGGNISFTSEEGEGSTFYLRVPQGITHHKTT
jgi:PAS domain S-box-containing protein